MQELQGKEKKLNRVVVGGPLFVSNQRMSIPGQSFHLKD